MNDRAALELALAANPDDFATHAAYADLLTEQGDPRGDYVRLQLALEDRQPARVAERARPQAAAFAGLRQREQLLEPMPAFAPIAPDVPERPDGHAEPHGFVLGRHASKARKLIREPHGEERLPAAFGRRGPLGHRNGELYV